MDIYFTGYFTAFIIISLVYIDHIKLNIEVLISVIIFLVELCVISYKVHQN